MRLIFARHGESQANVERIISNRDLGHPLTEKGRTQAASLAERLADDDVTAIYASPLLRAQETAQIIGERLGLPIFTTDALREFDCGVAEGRGDAEAWQAHSDVVAAWNAEHDYDRRIEDGESFNDMRARFVPFVESIIDQFGDTGQDVLCISHGALLTQMLPLMVANVDQELITEHGLGNCRTIAIELGHGTLTCIEWNGHKLEGAA